MPDINSSDDIITNIEGEDEETLDTNEVNEHGNAQDVESDISESSDNTTSENSEDDLNDLQVQLDKQRNSAETLGYVSSASARYLVDKAKAGDKEALELINSNSRVKDYIKGNKRLKKDYSELMNETKPENTGIDPNTMKADIKAEIKRDKDMDTIESLIGKSGVKGEESVNKMRRQAHALYEAGETPESAFSTAHYGVVGEKPSSQPKIPRGGKAKTGEKKLVIKKSEIKRIQDLAQGRITEKQAIEIAKSNEFFDSQDKIEGVPFVLT